MSDHLCGPYRDSDTEDCHMMPTTEAGKRFNAETLIDAVTWRSIFGEKVPMTRDMAVEQMTLGYVKRVLLPIIEAEAAEHALAAAREAVKGLPTWKLEGIDDIDRAAVLRILTPNPYEPDDPAHEVEERLRRTIDPLLGEPE